MGAHLPRRRRRLSTRSGHGEPTGRDTAARSGSGQRDAAPVTAKRVSAVLVRGGRSARRSSHVLFPPPSGAGLESATARGGAEAIRSEEDANELRGRGYRDGHGRSSLRERTETAFKLQEPILWPVTVLWRGLEPEALPRWRQRSRRVRSRRPDRLAVIRQENER